MVDPDDLLSPAYRELLKETHGGQKWGGGGRSWAIDIFKWCQRTGCETILDYGCGRSTLKGSIDIPVQEYDPGIPGKDAMPTPADMLVSTDVLEHIEPDKVKITLAHMRSLTLKASFHNIALSPARLTLPDGRNAHLSIRTEGEWLNSIIEAGFAVVRHEKRKGLCIWTRI